MRATSTRVTGGGQPTLLQRALSAIRRNGGTLLMVPDNYSGVFEDSAGITSVDALGDPIGRINDRTGANHATQATASQKPVVAQNAQGRRTISFDGTNDFLQTGITTGNEGWVCAGLSHSAAATAMAFSGGGESAAQAGACLRMAGGSTGCQLLVSDGAAQQIVQSPASITPGTVFVYDGGWTASIRFVAVNGAETSSSKSVNCTSTLTARIGGAVAGGLPLNGPMTALIYTPVLPSAADRALIRRWIGSLQGQTL